MKIVYAALDQMVPGTKGGSVHVQAVAEGLGSLGHEVHVLARPGAGGFPGGAVRWHDMRPPLGRPELRWLRAGAVTRLARQVRAGAIVERYYNFGGEGIIAGRRLGIISMLEVNAPVVDYPGSPKRVLDRAMLAEPMRRWREWQCRAANLIVTPTSAILPSFVDRAKVVELEWGADTRRFHPGAAGRARFTRRAGAVVAVFAGAFRSWHGASRLVEAIRLLRERGDARVDAVLVGDGPELGRVRAAAAGLSGVTLTGAIPHADMPATLAACDIGVAPFDVTAHRPLSLAFYWSPLKIFEYMASGLPVVAPRIARLERIVRHHSEGVLYDAGEASGLADAIASLADPSLRERLGRAARERVSAEFSWTAHCARLDEALRRSCACAC